MIHNYYMTNQLLFLQVIQSVANLLFRLFKSSAFSLKRIGMKMAKAYHVMSPALQFSKSGMH